MNVNFDSNNHSLIQCHQINSIPPYCEQLSISKTEYNSLYSTISNLNRQISILQSSNQLLLDSITTLTKTINNNNLLHVVSKLETVSIILNKAVSASKSNKITSYFAPQSSIHSRSNAKTAFRVKSTTISDFIKNEGLNVFSLKVHSSNYHFADDETRYVFQCIFCSKYNKNQVQGHSKYITGCILTQSQIQSVSHMKTSKKGIEKHVNMTTVHLSSVALSAANNKPSQALYIKVETVYFMLKRSAPSVVFKEIMVFIQRLIEHFQCDQHQYCLNIGDKQHSKHEAKRITKIFHKVVKKQTIHVINNQCYNDSNYHLVLFSLSIDGWSRGMNLFIFTFLSVFFYLFV